MSLNGTLLLAIPPAAAIRGSHPLKIGASEGLVPPLPRKKLTYAAGRKMPRGPTPHDCTCSGRELINAGFAATARSQFATKASVLTGFAFTGRFSLRPRFPL